MMLPRELRAIVAAEGKLTADLARLEDLFLRMDAAYERAAVSYGFACNGCEDNCCRTRFYHHTAVEAAFLHLGVDALDPTRKSLLWERAEAVAGEAADLARTGRIVRVMCPLNESGRCLLYARRPMICRLHGIPSELRKPGVPPVRGPGCEAFTDRCCHLPYAVFDRTPFYIELAALEQSARKTVGGLGKIRWTVAELFTALGDLGGAIETR